MSISSCGEGRHQTRFFGWQFCPHPGWIAAMQRTSGAGKLGADSLNDRNEGAQSDKLARG